MKHLLATKKWQLNSIVIFLLILSNFSIANIRFYSEFTIKELKSKITNDDTYVQYWYYMGSKNGYHHLIHEKYGISPIPFTGRKVKFYKISEKELNFMRTNSFSKNKSNWEIVFRTRQDKPFPNNIIVGIQYVPYYRTHINDGTLIIKEYFASGYMKSNKIYKKSKDGKWIPTETWELFKDIDLWVGSNQVLLERVEFKNGKLDGLRVVNHYEEDFGFAYRDEQHWKSGVPTTDVSRFDENDNLLLNHTKIPSPNFDIEYRHQIETTPVSTENK